VRFVDSLSKAAGGTDASRDQLDYIAFGRVMDTTRMRVELAYHPKWTTVEAFDDYVRGRGLTPIIDARWVRSMESRAVAVAQRWGN
jgi:UDP-glucose 4-epimerase